MTSDRKVAGSNLMIWGGTELHVEVSLSKILNPEIAPDVQLAPCVAAPAISKGPAMSWRLIQGASSLHPLAPVTPATPLKRGIKSGSIPATFMDKRKKMR